MADEDEEKDNLLAQLQACQLLLLDKDKIIKDMSDRIACLEASIENQSKTLDSINSNMALLSKQHTAKNASSNNSGLGKRSNPSTITNQHQPAKQQLLLDSNDSNHMVVDEQTPSPNNTVTENIVNNVSAQNQSNQPPTFAQITSKRSKPMPIQLSDLDHQSLDLLFNKLNEKFGHTSFDVVQLSAAMAPKIYPKDANIKQQISEFLSANDIQHNSYTEKDEKRQAFIIRGLNFGEESDNINHITQSLQQVGISNDIDCIKFITGSMKRNAAENKQQNVLYRVTLGPGENITGLQSIKVINGFKIKIEKQKKSSIIQCRRCQRFLHTANACAYDYRCVQCNQKHTAGDCPRSSNKQLPLECCNCSSIGHRQVGHSANNLVACYYFKTKHPALYTKFTNISQINSNHQHNQSETSNSSQQKHAYTGTTKTGSSIPAQTYSNTPISPRSRRDSIWSTGRIQTTLQTPANNPHNKINRNNQRDNASHTSKPVFASPVSKFDSNKINAFAGALVQLLQGLLNDH